jgi:hypothetical protein
LNSKTEGGNKRTYTCKLRKEGGGNGSYGGGKEDESVVLYVYVEFSNFDLLFYFFIWYKYNNLNLKVAIVKKSACQKQKKVLKSNKKK